MSLSSIAFAGSGEPSERARVRAADRAVVDRRRGDHDTRIRVGRNGRGGAECGRRVPRPARGCAALDLHRRRHRHPGHRARRRPGSCDRQVLELPRLPRAPARPSAPPLLRRAGVDAEEDGRGLRHRGQRLRRRLTAAEAARLRSAPGVAKLWKNEVHTARHDQHPRVSGPRRARTVCGRASSAATARAGEGVIVGVIDTGIWPENPSFAALPEPRPDADHRREVAR